MCKRAYRWSEDVRFRMGYEESSAQMNISVRISSGGGLGLGGREVGSAKVDTQAIGKELAKLRERQRDEKGAAWSGAASLSCDVHASTGAWRRRVVVGPKHVRHPPLCAVQKRRR